MPHLYNFTLTNAYEIVLALELCISFMYFLKNGVHLKPFACCKLTASVHDSLVYSHEGGVELFHCSACTVSAGKLWRSENLEWRAAPRSNRSIHQDACLPTCNFECSHTHRNDVLNAHAYITDKSRDLSRYSVFSITVATGERVAR